MDPEVQVDPVAADVSQDPLTLQELMDGNSIECTITYIQRLPNYGNRYQLIFVSVMAGDKEGHGVLAFHLDNPLPAIGDKLSLAPAVKPQGFPLVTVLN